MIRLVLLVLMIVLFLWVLYIRRTERLEIKKKEGYQIFTFPYTTEAPNPDFRGEHPEYSYREFFREHFIEREIYVSGTTCITPCSTITANSLNTIYPIDVSTGGENKGFVMTMEMGQLPKQYHYRTTHKKEVDSYYTGLDEAMVFNGFDINHEKTYAPGHNPNVRGFAGACQELVSGCSTTETGVKVCSGVDTYRSATGTDASTMQAFTHQSTALQDMKPGECVYEDRAKKYVWLKIGVEYKRITVQTKRFGKTFLFAYGKKKNYIFQSFNIGLGPNTGADYFELNIYVSAFGDRPPYYKGTRAIYAAFEVNPEIYYQLRTQYADGLVGNELFLETDDLGSYPTFDTNYGVSTFNVDENDVLLNLRVDGGTDADRYYSENFGQQMHENILRVVSKQQGISWYTFLANEPAMINFLNTSGLAKQVYSSRLRGQFLEVDPDKINPLFDKEIIHAPPLGQNLSSLLYNGDTDNPYLNFKGRAISAFDLNPAHLNNATSGVCSMTNVSHSNIAYPDNSDPNTTTFLSLNAAAGDTVQTKLNVTGPSKINSNYTSNLLTLEKHRNSIAYGGFAMNTISVNALTQSQRANPYTQDYPGVLNNSCTIASGVSDDILMKRKQLLDSGILVNTCTESDLDTDSKQCTQNPINRVMTALSILDTGYEILKVHFLMMQWTFIDWFANYRGYPSDEKCTSMLTTIFDNCYRAIVYRDYYGVAEPPNWTYYAPLQLFYPIRDSYVSKIRASREANLCKNQALYKELSNCIRNFDPCRTISSVLEQFLFDLYYAGADTVKLKAIINSYHPQSIKRTWIYALYPEDRKRSRLYFDGYAANASNRWASGAFKVNDPYEIIDAYNNPLSDSTFKTEVDNFVNGTGPPYIYKTGPWSYAGTYIEPFTGKTINLNDYFPVRSVVVPRRFTRGASDQATLPNSFPRVYSVLKFYSSTGKVVFTLFWAHIPLYPGCGYPTMNFEITDKYGKPDYMNNNYHDNIFVFYLIGDDKDLKDKLRENGVEPICDEDCYIESVYHGDALCLRAIDTPSKKLNCGNYAAFAEDGLKATFAPTDARAADVLGGEMGKFRIYVDQGGLFVFKTKISTHPDAVDEYTVYSDYITVPGMSSCTGFSCWTPFREINGSQSVFKRIKIENPDFSEATSTSQPKLTDPAELSVTDSYKNIAQKKEMIQTYSIFKNPCNPARVNSPVIRNVNLLKAEGWRIVNVGTGAPSDRPWEIPWVDPKVSYLNYYKVNQKEDYSTPPLNLNYSTYKETDQYGGMVGIMVSKWGLPTQEKYISRGEWIQLDLLNPFQFNQYAIKVPSKFVTNDNSVEANNGGDRLAYNRSISEWTLVGSNDTTQSKNWILIDYVKEADFRYNSNGITGTTAAGNQMTMQDTTFRGTLLRPASYRYVRLIINALDHGNFENIFTIGYFGVRSSTGVWKPTKGSVNPTDITVTTSVLPYGFDNNYIYGDPSSIYRRKPLVPLINGESYNDKKYSNKSLGKYTYGDYGTLINYYSDKLDNDQYSCGTFCIPSSSIYLQGLDNPFSYKERLTMPVTNTASRYQNWIRDTATKNSLDGAPINPYILYNPDILSYFSQYTDYLNEYTSSAKYLNITLGKHTFSWQEMHMFLDIPLYTGIYTQINPSQTQYNELIKYAIYNYTKIVRDNTWNLKYNMTYDRRKDKFYEGSVITTYSLPCGINDPSATNSSVCYPLAEEINIGGTIFTAARNNPAPSTGYNNSRPDQEVADPRFCWPQPYQGGSYLVSDSVKCIPGQTCNSIGGNKDNVCPKYCFWIGDAATYDLLRERYSFPVQQDFNMNIMFDGDTNIYNDVPLQCLGKLTLANLDTTTPLSMFYPPPSLYRMKRWRLINYQGGNTLTSGSTTLKNAIISENGKLVFTFPDVQTALAYKQYDTEEPDRVTAYSGCQGPPLVGTSVSISCPAGRIKASSGNIRDVREGTSHIRWGKWEKSACRDSFGDDLTQADYKELPQKCVGQTSCTLTERDFGYSYPEGLFFDESGILKGITRLTLGYGNGYQENRVLNISDIKIYSDESTIMGGYTISESSKLDPLLNVQSTLSDGLDSTYWTSSPFDSEPFLEINFLKPSDIYKVLITNRTDCCSSSISGVSLKAFRQEINVLTSDSFQNIHLNTTYSNNNEGFKYYHIFPGRSTMVFGSYSISVASPPITNPYQKNQWQVGFVCDDSNISNSSSVYEIPAGVSSVKIHENYHNLMKTINRQAGNTFDIADFPETLKWYQTQMEKEIVESPEFKSYIRQENKKIVKNKEHYWDGDVCKPVGTVLNNVGNGILDTIYNPMVNGINKLKILRTNLGLSPLTVNVGWSCPIPGLGEFMAAIVNAAIAVGKALVAAFNFVCALGEALVGTLINTGKFLINRLGDTFSRQRMRKFLGAFSAGYNGGFSLIGARIAENFVFVEEAAMALASAASNFGSSVLNFFMEPSLENFIGVVSSLLVLGVESFIFVINVGIFLVTVLADVVGSVINFFSDVGSWIETSIIGPIAQGIEDAYNDIAQGIEEFGEDVAQDLTDAYNDVVDWFSGWW